MGISSVDFREKNLILSSRQIFNAEIHVDSAGAKGFKDEFLFVDTDKDNSANIVTEGSHEQDELIIKNIVLEPVFNKTLEQIKNMAERKKPGF